MKKLLCSAILCLSAFANAQETATKIPSDAVVVAAVKGGNLLQLMSVNDLNASYFGKEILKELNKKGEQAYSSLEDFGFDLNATSHYFYQIKDSINYNAFIVPIKEVSKFENFITTQSKKEIVSENGVRTFKDQDEIVMVWNESMLVLVMGSTSDYFFSDPVVMERYGLEDLYSYDEAVVESTEVYEDYPEEENIEAEEIEETVIESTETYDDDEDVVEEVVIEDYDDSSYYDYYNGNYEKKKALAKEWSLKRAKDILAQPESQSIIFNKSYQNSLDDNAEATLWVSDFGAIYQNLLGDSMYYTGLSDFNIGSMYADSGMIAKLFMEKDKMQINTIYTVSDEMADSYKKMTSRKLNSKFFKYINEDRMMGYMSYAMSTKAALEEYPKILKNLYASMPMYGDEADLAIDFVALLLDEEAIAKVFTGDMLFLLSGISQKEVTYTSYEYNDDYEYETVEKTKMETVPDFLLMASTDDSKFLNKLIDYAMKKQVVVYERGYYALKIPESPLAVYFTIKNGIVFMGTSEMEMYKIVAGTFDAKLSSKHKKMLKNSTYSAYLSGKQLASKLPIDDMSLDAVTKLNWFLKNSEDGYITSSRIKGNEIKTEMVIEVPASEENSLKYLFNIIETFAK